MDIHNLVILSRFPITANHQIRHELVPSWAWTPPAIGSSIPLPVQVSWDRPVLHACIDPGSGHPLHILNLHLRASRAAPILEKAKSAAWQSTSSWAEGFYLAAQKQIGQALEVRLLVDRLFDADAAADILVCGDMNADEHEMPVRLLCAAPGDTGAPELTARSLLPLEDRLPQAARFSVCHAGRPVMLDHLLASQPLARRCTGVEVFNEGLGDEAYAPEDPPGSLHAVLVAAFLDR